MSTAGSSATPPHEKPRFRFECGKDLPDLLAELACSLLVTTYQAGMLLALRPEQGRISIVRRSFEKAMGLAFDGQRMALGTRNQVWLFRNAPEMAARLRPVGRYDGCYVPRQSFVTGDVHGHEIGWVGNELILIATRFSCLAAVDADFSFRPVWKPPFISRLVPEDRCHLNGMAIAEGQVQFVTALGESDEPQGWRPGKAQGGIVIHVPSGEVVARGLCMPHSPRLHQGKLYLLDSGQGRLIWLDPRSGQRETVAELPGYARGLAIQGRYAFVGLSQTRDEGTFSGLPLAERVAERACGVWVVDLQSGKTVSYLRFALPLRELFDVQLLSSSRFPAIVGLQKQALRRMFLLAHEED